MTDRAQSRIAAVVVTYNRKELLRECLQSLLNQTYPLSQIIVVNNASTDGTSDMLRAEHFLGLSTMNYLELNENLGGAGGFHVGMAEGVEKGFDWLWIMDDDCIPHRDALELLVKHDLFHDRSTAALCSTVSTPDGTIGELHRKYIDDSLSMVPIRTQVYATNHFEIDIFSFVGVLLSTDHVKKVGLPLKELFIFWDDAEYAMRLSQSGKLHVIAASVVLHKSLPGDDGSVSWRLFFRTRNAIFTYKRYIASARMGWIKKCRAFIMVLLVGYIFKPLLRGILISSYRGRRCVYYRIVLPAVYQGISGDFTNDIQGLHAMLKPKTPRKTS